METGKYIDCPNCNTTYRVPSIDKSLKITCRNCHEEFYMNFPKVWEKYRQQETSKWNIKKFLIPGIIIAVLVAIFWFNQDLSNQASKIRKSMVSLIKSSNWVTIEYGGLVNTSILTHNGETVGDIIKKIPMYNEDLKGLVQQYLEPNSILCHDVLLSTIEPDTPTLVNILDHYPVGSEQPAWIDLFKEGHYQLYYNSHLIRVFLKGSEPKSSFDKYHSVIRHPIRDVMNNRKTSIDKVEVYVFNNDYAKTEIRLNTIPEVFDAKELDLSPKRRSIDLDSIEEFLAQGVILEAVEVDANNNLYFYGRKAKVQTLAGYYLSLSDIAVIYRSIFHFGNNAPYISLDKHEDNRYAKVNFGGNLENTHAGSVVLEADKLFKALSTGIDPNTHKLIKSKITKEVPEFYTEDERNLFEDRNEGHTQIRYWFYPDSIGTVTDGSIGAVLNHQFLADVERMDVKVNASRATRNTIAHLNQNFTQYENAEDTFKELSTVGRIMALVNWLKGMDIDKRIELDDLLSVKIPSFTTPKKTKKIMAVTALAHTRGDYKSLHTIRNNSRVYYISHLLDNYSSNTTDKYFLNNVAGDYCSQIDITEIAPTEYKELKESLENIDRTIDQKKRTLNHYSSRDVNNYNELIAKQNILANKLNNMDIESRYMMSISGGINLRPNEFKRISRNRNSPKLREINSAKGKMKTVGKIAKSGNWIRSNPTGKSGSRINKLPINAWTSSKSEIGKTKYKTSSNGKRFEFYQ